jgi:hypothetical protein
MGGDFLNSVNRRPFFVDSFIDVLKHLHTLAFGITFAHISRQPNHRLPIK